MLKASGICGVTSASLAFEAKNGRNENSVLSMYNRSDENGCSTRVSTMKVDKGFKDTEKDGSVTLEKAK